LFLARQPPQLAMASSVTRFLYHTQRRTIVSRTPLDQWSARRRDLYLTTHNTYNRQTSMPPVGLRTHDLSRRAAADLRLRSRGLNIPRCSYQIRIPSFFRYRLLNLFLTWICLTQGYYI
jgi:hypothetical protein